MRSIIRKIRKILIYVKLLSCQLAKKPRLNSFAKLAAAQSDVNVFPKKFRRFLDAIPDTL